MCNACGKWNHFAKVCQPKVKNQQGNIKSIKDKEATMDDLIEHLTFNPETYSYTLSNGNVCKEVETTLIPFSSHPDPRQAKDIPNASKTKLRIQPDGSATTCLKGPKHWQNMVCEAHTVLSGISPI